MWGWRRGLEKGGGKGQGLEKRWEVHVGKGREGTRGMGKGEEGGRKGELGEGQIEAGFWVGGCREGVWGREGVKRGV